jgi:hypothetical protein
LVVRPRRMTHAAPPATSANPIPPTHRSIAPRHVRGAALEPPRVDARQPRIHSPVRSCAGTSFQRSPAPVAATDFLPGASMKLILCIACAAICFSGVACANAPASRTIDTPITPDALAPVAPTQARGDDPVLVAPTCTGSRCANNQEPLLVAPTCGSSCARGAMGPLRMAPTCGSCCPGSGAAPLRMAPGCPSCMRHGTEPLRVAPTGCNPGCQRRGEEPLRMAPNCLTCTKRGQHGDEPVRMAPNCATCTKRDAEPLRVAPTCGSKCEDKLA